MHLFQAGSRAYLEAANSFMAASFYWHISYLPLD
jgi:hypothetical protein